MRLVARKPVKVGEVVIGGERPLICVPVVAEDEKSLIEQAHKNAAVNPDLIEWRADFYRGIRDARLLRNALSILKEIAGKIPVIFTLRAKAEGGAQEIPLEERLTLIMEAVASNVPDIIDIELSSGAEAVKEVVNKAGEKGMATILSYHNFESTPSADAIYEKMNMAQKLGGSIAKVAVMPQEPGDVLRLFEASLRARRELDIPLIALAMGKLGVISRVGGFLFGSDVTFAVGGLASAPGQIPIDKLRRAMEALF